MPIIRLSDTDTQAFKDPYFIQKDAKDDFEKLIQRFIRSSSDKGNDDDCGYQSTCTEAARVHNTILINGKRGMGKTSFILSVLEQKADWLDDVCNLCIIDPTMIETKEHIFLNIIARIKERVDKYRDRGCRVSDECFRAWVCSLKKLAGGLNVLDGVGKDPLQDDLWDSPELILERGLDNSKQGWLLERNFHTFLEASLKLLEKKAFLLVLDDIDTSLKEGKAILEILRKYLTSKKLIIVMLGDIDLYTTIVRQLQWEKMDPEGTLLKYEKEGCGDNKFYRSQIEHLEEQYLTKLLKPENRIKLQTTLELKERLNVQLNEEDAHPLIKHVNDLVQNVFLTKNQYRYSKLYEQTLLAQSTRSVVQVLRGARDCKILFSNPDNKKQFDLNPFVEVLRQVFFTTLKKHLEPFELLYTTNDRNLLNHVALYMLRNMINRDSHMKLLPEYREDEKNVTSFFLNAAINAQLQPKHYLSYFIKVGYALECFESLSDQNHDKFFNHIGLDSDISNSHIAKRLLTTFKVDSNTHLNPVFFGNIFLSINNHKKINKGDNMALLMSRVINGNAHFTFLSLFNLLGVLADIALLTDSSNGQEERINALKSLNLIRDFHSYHKDTSGRSRDNSDDEKDDSSTKFKIEDSVISDLITWSDKVINIKQYLSATDLANIWIRLSYTLNGIDSHPKNKQKNYYERLELYIAALLNAVYVCCEEKKDKKDKTIDITNPLTSPKHFYDKLDNYRIEDEWTFFDYLYKCPAFDKENQYYTSLFEELKNLTSEDKTNTATTNKKSKKRNTTNKEKAKDFKILPKNKQIEEIKSTTNWQKNKTSTVRSNLVNRLNYNLKPSDDNMIKELIEIAKGEL